LKIGVVPVNVLATLRKLGRTIMPAYVIPEHVITDAAKFEEYRGKGADNGQVWRARALSDKGRKPQNA
jgi:hypothetical protein